MVVYRTREGPIGAVNVWTVLATQGSVTAPGELQVPNHKTKIKQMIVGIGANTPTAAMHGAAYLVRLSGGGLKYGEQVFAVGGRWTAFTTSGQTGGGNVYSYDVDMDVVPGSAITIESCPVNGSVTETNEVAVTLAFT